MSAGLADVAVVRSEVVRSRMGARGASMRWLWPGATDVALTSAGAFGLDFSGAALAEAGAVGRGRQVEPAGTNLVTNPSFETGTAGWASFNGASIAQDGGDARFGSSSLLVTTPGSVGDEGATQSALIAVSPSTTYTCSMWFAGASGNVHINLNAYTGGGAYVTTHFGPSTALTGAWQRIAFTFTTGATTGQVDLYALTFGAQAMSFRVDGVQLEVGAYASSTIDGSLGSGYAWTGTAHASSSTRAASRVRAASWALDARRGAVAAWVRPAWGSGGAPAAPRLLRVAPSANEALDLLFDHATGRWRFDSTHGGVTDSVASAVDSFSGGASKVVVASWAATRIGISVDGGAPVTAARAAGVPVLGATPIDFGSIDGASGHLDGVIGPIAIFDRPLDLHELAIVGRLARPLGWRELG
ncbi:MAG: carbohydrate binding domain-containing protein [Dehalococcoidia bacterium]